MRSTVTLGFLLLSSIASAGTRGAPILGGTQTQPGDFPSVVAFQAGQGLCTGTLIAPEWVLTAAHCIQGLQPANVHVFFGTVNIHQQTGVVRVASELYPHPEFRIGKHDVGLIKLATPVNDIRPVPVNLIAENATIGMNVTMVGFGTTAVGGGGSIGIQYMVEQTVVPCNQFAGSDVDLLCFSQTSGKGKCQGDSGGPSFAMVNGQMVQVGITSFGDQFCAQFGADTRTDAEREFLLKYVPQLECSTDDDCPEGRACFLKKCIAQPFSPTGLGSSCQGNSDCESQQCGTAGNSAYCTMQCTLGVPESCPAGLECTEAAGGTGVCWPIAEDSGCCDARGAGAPTALLGTLCIGLVLGRRRRRASR